MKPTVRPSFYDAFKCVGAACRVSCCTGFRISLLPGEEKRLPRESLAEDSRSRYVVMRPNGDCPFWTAAHRCALQHGDDQSVLPGVCRVFPRVVSPYSDRTEIYLDAYCPEVYRLVSTWEIGDFRISGGPLSDAPVWRQRAEQMDAYRTLELPGTAPVFVDYLRRLGAYLVFTNFPIYKDYPAAQGVFGPVRRFIEEMAGRSREFATVNGEWFDFLCREWRKYSSAYGFDFETEGCYKTQEEMVGK